MKYMQEDWSFLAVFSDCSLLAVFFDYSLLAIFYLCPGTMVEKKDKKTTIHLLYMQPAGVQGGLLVFLSFHHSVVG